jgi:hypothetical protein
MAMVVVKLLTHLAPVQPTFLLASIGKNQTSTL